MVAKRLSDDAEAGSSSSGKTLRFNGMPKKRPQKEDAPLINYLTLLLRIFRISLNLTVSDMRTLVLKILIFCLLSLVNANPRGPLTDHFQNWLIANGYENDAFDRPDVGPNGSFGGKVSGSEKVEL